MGYPDLRLCKVLGKLLSWPTFKARPTDAARFLGPLVEKERRRIDLTNKRRVLSLERIQLSQKSTRNQPEINQKSTSQWEILVCYQPWAKLILVSTGDANHAMLVA